MSRIYKQVNTAIDHMSGHWSNYDKDAIGRAIHYVHKVCGMDTAERIVFHGDGRITLGQTQSFATVNWDNGYPNIKYDKRNYNDRQKELLKKGYDAFAAPS